MAIKITKPGQKEFHGFCTWCGCEFTYEISDLKLSATGNKLNCPTCGKDYFHQSMVQDPTIPGGIGRLQTWPPEPIPCTPDMTKTDPCAGCVWRENLYRDGLYVGDTPCTWCDKNKFNTIKANEPMQKLDDYITLCSVKAPEAHLSGPGKTCNCDENAVCSECSGPSGVITTTHCGLGRDTKEDYKTDVSACDGCVATCPVKGDVWKTITECCNNCVNELNDKQSNT